MKAAITFSFFEEGIGNSREVGEPTDAGDAEEDSDAISACTTTLKLKN